jgi:hypothetical protein
MPGNECSGLRPELFLGTNNLPRGLVYQVSGVDRDSTLGDRKGLYFSIVTLTSDIPIGENLTGRETSQEVSTSYSAVGSRSRKPPSHSREPQHYQASRPVMALVDDAKCMQSA